MTVSSTTTKNSYSGDGSTTTFAYAFKIFADADLTVILRSAAGTETVQTLTTNYTVTNAGNASGGNVEFVTAPASGVTVVIRRNMAQTQSTDYVANDPFPAATHEDALDRLTFIAQQQQEEVDRSIKLSRTNTMTSTEFTVGATDRANKVLAFDGNGELSVTQELGTYQGTDATITTEAYAVRDIIKSTTAAQLNNVYICVATSVAGDLLTDTDHFELLVDAVSAATSATNAANSASAASTSESNAATSESNASTSETNASNAQTAAETAQSAAETAQSAAETAQAAAETALDTFDDRFLGAKASDPTVDNDGNALIDGALYFDTTNDIMKVYDLTNTTWRQLTLTSANQTNVNTVAGQISPTNNIATVAGADSNITTVAGSIANVNTTATNIANINSVAANESNINSAAGNESNINAVVSNASNINAVAGNASNINAVSSDITNVNTVATNISSVNSFSEVYRISASAPTTSLDLGDLYFDTTSDTLKVYGASGWQNAGSSINGTSQRYHYDITGTPTSVTGADANGNTLTYDAGYVDVYVNGVRMSTADVTVTSGDTVTFAEALADGDEVDIVGYGTFSVASLNADNLDSGTVPSARVSGAYTGITGTGTLTGLTVNGNVSVDGGTIKLDGNYPLGTGNSALGDNALNSITSGSYNVAIGLNAGTSITTSSDNVVIGVGANEGNGLNNTAIGRAALQTGTGGNNVAVGKSALTVNTADNNTAVGYQAGYANTTGTATTAVGSFSAKNNTTGQITAIGYAALEANTTASNNTAVGVGAARVNTTGASNVAVGAEALRFNTTASNNVAVGYQAGYSTTTGAQNTYLGMYAGYATQVGVRSTYVGYSSGPNSGNTPLANSDNISMGVESLWGITSGSYNTALGNYALRNNNTASNNTAVGYQALTANTTGYDNSAFGTGTLIANTEGFRNVAMGRYALSSNTTGDDNVAIGNSSLGNSTTANNNTAVGYAALNANTTGTTNTALGLNALVANTTAADNTALGGSTLQANTTGANNTAVGRQALQANTTASYNTAVGYRAGYSTTGDQNTFVGKFAGNLVTTGSLNTIIGAYNGNQAGLDIRTASNYIVLSDGGGTPRVVVSNTGYTYMSPSISSADRYGNTSHVMHQTLGDITTILENSNASNPYGLLMDFSAATPNNEASYFLNCYDSTTNRILIWSNGDIENQNNSYTGFSDEKLKEQIKDASSQWEDIKALKVRNFKFKTDVATGDSDSHWRLGVIAQEVETAGMNGLVKNTTDRDRNNDDLGTTTKKVKYSILYMKAVKALQEAMERIETLEAKVATLEGE